MANIMSMVKLKNKTSRNGFDLSRKNAFTAKVGELLPVACIECLPGDKFDLEIQHFTRTRPVNTAAYTRIREYYDWFFVPTDLMWNKFNSVITQIVDNGQHAQGIQANETLSNYIPYARLDDIEQYIVSAKAKNNAYGYNRADLTVKLLSYLGYGDLSYNSNDPYTDANSTIKNVAVNLFPLLAYQKIYSDFYRNSQWEKAFAPAFNLDYIKGTDDLIIPIDTLSANIGNTENMFDLRYRNWNKDLFMGVLPSAQYGSTATINFSSLTSNLSNFPFYVYYGLEDDGHDANFNNLSPVAGVTQAHVGFNSSNSADIKMNGLSIAGKPTAYDAYPTSNQLIRLKQYISASDMSRLSSALGLSGSSNSFSILGLRLAEAEQMWKEITQSTQQDYKSQLEAHWGVNVSDAYSDRCNYIGGSVSNLDISEVVNTNITDTNEASVAGKGVGVGQGREKFSTDVHGYLMCIYSAVPLLDYSISGIKRMCTRTQATDFAIPEFDAVGMEALGLEQLMNSTFSTRVPDESSLITNLGYVPRYIDYKTAYDEVNGAFRKQTDGLNDWVAPLTNQYFEEYFQGLVSSGIGVSGSLTYQFFKVNPNILDPIFDVNANSSVSTDQLWVNAAFDIKAVRKLDRNGLPY